MLKPFGALILAATCWAATCCSPHAIGQEASSPGKPTEWRRLFNGRDLDGWKVTNFGGEGEVAVEDGTLILNMGSSMTGVTYLRPFPKTRFEVRCEAKRAEGHDFFCGMTFPVADSHCSLIVGGWGGGVVGLSSLNGHDASENETTQYIKFEDDKWYKFRVRVEPKRIQAWIDAKQIIDVDIEGQRISTRIEVDLNKPFGFASYETKAVLRNIELRELAPGETSDDQK
jgi:hypothetical protein